MSRTSVPWCCCPLRSLRYYKSQFSSPGIIMFWWKGAQTGPQGSRTAVRRFVHARDPSTAHACESIWWCCYLAASRHWSMRIGRLVRKSTVRRKATYVYKVPTTWRGQSRDSRESCPLRNANPGENPQPIVQCLSLGRFLSAAHLAYSSVDSFPFSYI